MKQFAFLCMLMIVTAVGGLINPFWAVLGYYTLAVLRPQYLWDWALPMEVRWSLIAAVVTLVMVVVHASRLFKRGRFNMTATVMLAYAVLVMMSVITAYNPATAQMWATDFAKVLLMAMIATFVIEHLWQVRATAVMIGLCLGYIAYEINFNYFVHDARLDVFHYGYGGLDNNGAGLMLAMGLPFAYCYLLSRDRRVRIVAAGVGLVLLHSVMLTYSRGAMLSAVVGLAWLGWHHRPRWQVAAAAPVVLAVMLTLAGPEVRQEFLSMREYKQDRSATARFDSWRAGWEMTWAHPVFGAGLRNSNHYSHNYGADRGERTIHNQYLQIAADSGVPAALMYLALLGSAMWRLHTARRGAWGYRVAHYRDNEEDTARELLEAERLCLAVQASLVIFAINGIFLSLETFELPWLLIVLAGVLPGVVRRRLASLDKSEEDRPKEKSRSSKRFTFAPPVPNPAFAETTP